jgi:hypothetical protein
MIAGGHDEATALARSVISQFLPGFRRKKGRFHLGCHHMSRDPIFAPVLVQVLLTLGVYVALIRAKVRAMKAGQVDMTRRALHDDAWPESVMKINNNIRNQFEVPVLFYVVAFALWALDAVHVAALAAAWLFVASRVVHAHVHTGSNVVAIRRRVFTFGWLMVLVMALLVAWELGKRALGAGPY